MSEEKQETPKEEQKELPKEEETKNYFPGASDFGKLFNINGMIWLVRQPIDVISEDGQKEKGWNAYNLSDNAKYHFFVESEIQEQNLVIQEIG